MALYRYLPRKHVKKFKEEGILKISPIKKYRSTGDQREDTTEGYKTTLLEFRGKLSREEAKEILGFDNSIELCHGGIINNRLALPEGFLLSASSILSTDIMARFGYDDFFTIINPSIFENAVCRALASELKDPFAIAFKRNGKVSYVSDKSVHVVRIDDLRKMGALSKAWVTEDYFVKHKDPYGIEYEHRFIFLVDDQNIKEDAFIQLTKAEIEASCSFDYHFPKPGSLPTLKY